MANTNTDIVTAETAATEIVDNMSRDDIHGFTREGWRDGISSMMQGAWEHLNDSEVLDEVERLVANKR